MGRHARPKRLRRGFVGVGGVWGWADGLRGEIGGMVGYKISWSPQFA